MTEQRVHHLLEKQRVERPEAIALRDHDGVEYSYEALAHAVDWMSMDLAARGLRAGDRLLVVAENCAAQVGLVLAASQLDAIAVPVNARMTEHELHRIANHADPRLSVYLGNVSGPARTHAEIGDAVHWDTPLGALLISPEVRQALPEPVRDDAKQIAVLLYTTGTTGTPKGVMLSHGNLLYGGKTSALMRGLVPEDLILGVLPMTHVFGLASMCVGGLAAGSTLWLMPRFSASAVIDALEAGVTVLPAVPQIHASIMAEASRRGLDHAPGGYIRYVSSGAAPLDPEWKRMAEAFYGIALQNGYGMTETSAGVTLTTNPIGVPDVSVGRALPNVELRLGSVGEDGVGEVLTRGPHVTPGYFHNEQATQEAFDADGFLRTGDLGRLDDAGNLHIAGRSRELIIRGGFNVYPPEVEAALNDHPKVVQTAVIGRTTEGGNEEVLAFCQVARESDVTEADLLEHVVDRLSPYKRPSRIVIATELPAAPTGKILKNKLLGVFADRL
ncbi:acyl--CoA ligase [Salipiger thiooxidans]|uniref:class I adenylate-forming enzyme family protein n=1 Tax=Salipiger thiooxidans TaxID=282683 RepID=UPI001A8CF44A|nr:class I adenylate-forming enzyme family protein [Salipiger thiooxidans]MBN8188784.1 acyl--CoA ligase [Salipiger thiooxidans]